MAVPRKLPVRNGSQETTVTALRDEDYFTRLAYRKSGGSRYTQDSPILADVIVHFGLLKDKGRPLDLLLTPDWSKSPGDVAEAVRHWLEEPRRPVPEDSESHEPPEDSEPHGPPASPDRDSPSDHWIAYNQSVVAVKVSFEELVCSVVPLSSWWQERLVAPQGRDPVNVLSDPKLREIALTELLEGLRFEIADDSKSSEDEDEEPSGDERARPVWERRHWLIRQELARAARLFYVVRHSNIDGEWHERDDQPERIAEYFVGLIERIGGRRERRSDTKAPPAGAWVYTINRNRPIKRTVLDSVPTCKADAARTTFGVTAKDICWAVIDTGIDARHIAFRKRNGDAPYPEPFKGDGDECYTRIRATYDFSDIRRQLSKVQQRSLLGGRLLNWEELERRLKLRVPHTRQGYRTPLDGHGTHVAGILAANWQPDPDAIDPLGPPPLRCMPTQPIVGLCPEIELYDLRVFKHGRGDEFAVMSALQFVRSLNQRHDKLEVHGVNLSLAMLHEVSNYACGRSPVCEECSRLVGTGVVVVAAAGNEGRSIYTTTQERKEEGYRTVSIADPGNTEAVITVGSTHRREPHTYGVSYFSSRGPTGDGRCKPDLVAPGEKILSAVPWDGSACVDGTSQAAPHVSGAAALLMGRHRELIGQPGRIKEILMDTATDLGRERYFQGAGLVDVMRAIQSI